MEKAGTFGVAEANDGEGLLGHAEYIEFDALVAPGQNQYMV